MQGQYPCIPFSTSTPSSRRCYGHDDVASMASMAYERRRRRGGTPPDAIDANATPSTPLTYRNTQGVKRYFYSSSACVYNDDLQLDPENPGLKEGDAWPAKPQDTYGLEKLYAEEMGIVYGRDFGIKFRCARFHNVYGPRGTWKGGREKAPAAFCRKAVCATTEFEMWGDGKQTRSFMFIDDCVQGIQKIMDSDCEQPLNLGSDEMIDMNDFAKLALSFESKNLPIKHIPGPEGVRGRNSDNQMIKEKLGWAPSIPVAEGLKKTYFWIKEQVEKDKAAGIDITKLGTSEIVVQTTDDLDELAAQGLAGKC